MLRHKHTARWASTAAALLSVLLLAVLPKAATAASASGTRIIRGFDGPNSMLLSGKDLFVTNWTGGPTHNGWVSEINATDGNLVRNIAGAAYRFNGPVFMTMVGADLFVLNGRSDSVTELNAATGTAVRVIFGPAYHIENPCGISHFGEDLLVLNCVPGGGISEIDLATGSPGKMLPDPAPEQGCLPDEPNTMTLKGEEVFLADLSNGSLIELNALTGGLDTAVAAPAYQLEVPYAMAVKGNDVFIVDRGNGSTDLGQVTEVNASTDALVRVIAGPSYHFDQPDAITFSGTDLFIANAGTTSIRGSVTEVDATTGSLVRWFSSPDSFDSPSDLTVSGYDLFVANAGATTSDPGYLTEIPLEQDASKPPPAAAAATGAQVSLARSVGTAMSRLSSSRVAFSTRATRDSYGQTVAISGGTMVVGAWYQAAGVGRAYVYTKEANGWQQAAELQSTDPSADAHFGVSVAISGSTIVVGSDEGLAFVFAKTAAGWKQVTALVSTDRVNGDYFGDRVAISAGTMVADALGRDSGSGRAYVFTKGSCWDETAEFKATDTEKGDEFGVQSISGRTMVATSGSYDTLSSGRTGRAYVFTLTPSGWRQTAELQASETVAGDGFGVSAAVSGPVVAVGAPFHSSQAGRVYVFTRDRSRWQETAELHGEDTVAYDDFGSAVAISGNTLVVGAYLHDDSTGAVYVFTKTPTGWRQTDELQPAGTVPGSGFGTAVAMSGPYLAVGASGYLGGQCARGSTTKCLIGWPGRVYIFEKTATGWALRAQVVDPAEE